MADRFRGHERRFSDTGAYSHPLAESLIGRLDQLDIRLRHLEEKQSLPESYFAADLWRAAARNGHHQQCMSLSSAHDNVRLKGTLVDRLHLLETRIRELSSKLDKGGSNAERARDETGLSQTVANEKSKKQADVLSTSIVVGGSSWRAGDMFRKSTTEVQAKKSKSKKVKDPKDPVDAMKKRSSSTCRDEKRREESTRICSRWFPVGC